MQNQLTLTFIAFFVALSSFAQEFSVPKKGAKLYVDNNTIEVTENGKTSFDVYLIKSKAARKANFEAPKLIGPSGIQHLVTRDDTNPQRYLVEIEAKEITKGDYSLTITGKRSGIHVVTGKILTLKVNASIPIASKDGE